MSAMILRICRGRSLRVLCSRFIFHGWNSFVLFSV